MPNWASVSYRIVGPKEILQKVYDAVQYPMIEEGSSEDWEGNVLKTLKPDWKCPEGESIRGFIQYFDLQKSDECEYIILDADEAWGLTCFHEELSKIFPDLNIFYIVEEPGLEVYHTNDVEGVFFPERLYVDACIDNDYYSEYFQTEKDAYHYIAKITKGAIKSKDDLERFNKDNTNENDFISVHEFEIDE